MNQRRSKASLDDDGITYKSLLRFVKDARNQLQHLGYEDEAHMWDMFAEYLQNDFSPSKGLKFDTRILGL